MFLLFILAATSTLISSEWIAEAEMTHHRTSRGSEDPHDDQFCVDISSFDPVKWVEIPAEECKTNFVKHCWDEKTEVCADVLETTCDVVPYTECTMGVVPIDYNETLFAPVGFTPQDCITTTTEVPHTKMIPECKNVTKQNCVTLWETDDNGKQVWGGNEDCEPVTWQECTLVPVQVSFPVPDVVCVDGQELWYHAPKPVTSRRGSNTMTCVVKKTTHCEGKTTKKCKPVTYQECKEVPVETCKPKHVHKPTQEKVHRKKCLLPDNRGLPSRPTLPQKTYRRRPSTSPRKKYV